MTREPRRTKESLRTAVNRRLVAAGAALGIVGWIGARFGRLEDGSLWAESAILRALRDQVSASRIGRLAMASWPSLRERSAVLAQLLADLQLDADAAVRADVGELRGRLSRSIRTDYARGQTIKLSGWILTWTEARLCALAELNTLRSGS